MRFSCFRRRFFKELCAEFRYDFYRSSRARKVLFEHLPKCGGTTFRDSLKQYYPYRKRYPTDRNGDDSVRGFRELSESRRYGYDLVFGHNAHYLVGEAHPDCLKITVFREPVERVISHYYYTRDKHGITCSLEEYVRSDAHRNWYVTHFSGLKADEAEAAPSDAVEKAFRVIKETYDLVGFLDQLDVFMDRLRMMAGFRGPLGEQRLNVGCGKPGQLSHEERKQIEKANLLDTELYRRLRDEFAFSSTNES
ncbi:hypothetical protein EGM51_07975 [Verrucomicrobia bacterium S94]|nr:hypothetical protein EGM51_07975 [Verrucomicrobia bacterium S94]